MSTATDAVEGVPGVLTPDELAGMQPGGYGLARTVIEPGSGRVSLDLRELWRYRELLYFLAWRDVKIRYKQTVLGAAWAILQPLATMVVLSLFFRSAAGDPASPVPYSLFVLAGLVPWMFFSNAIAQAASSVVGNHNLVTKVYFPRLMIPLAAVGAGLVDLAIALCMLLILTVWFGIVPGLALALVPLVLSGLVIAALGVGTLLAALTVGYRDFRYVVPFMVQLWMFATPSIYLQAGSATDSLLARLLPLNPAQGLIAGLRAAMVGGPIDGYSLSVSWMMSALLLVGGCLYFRYVEHDFADII